MLKLEEVLKHSPTLEAAAEWLVSMCNRMEQDIACISTVRDNFQNGLQLMQDQMESLYADAITGMSDEQKAAWKSRLGHPVLAERTSDSCDFGEALNLLKAGERIARSGWNGKGMWLVLVQEWGAQIETHGQVNMLRSFIAMKTADNELVPWVASQTDMLATDWVEVTK